ncbi:MAG: hypothetical protein ABI947_15480 [Chloroflexota bacterium]
MLQRVKYCIMLAILLIASGPSGVYAQHAALFQETSSCIPAPGSLPRFKGARPEPLVLQDVELLTQPRFTTEAQPIVLVTIPKNARVVVFDIDNKLGKWYRVLWACDNFRYAGWVPKETIRFSSINVNPKEAPPVCVKSITTVDSIDTTWTSTTKGRLVAVVDLFRNPTGTEYPSSFFYLSRNGKDLKDKDRNFHTAGPFLMNGVVINATVSLGNVIGFSVVGGSNEPVQLFATFYTVPDGCVWDVS